MHDFIVLSTTPWGVLSLLPRDRSDLRPYMHGYLRGPRAGQKRKISICTCAPLRDISKFIVHYGNADEYLILY